MANKRDGGVRVRFPSLTLLKVRCKMANEVMAGLKRTVKALLEKHHEEVRGLHLTMYGGRSVAVTYAARNVGEKHFMRHKAGLNRVEDRVELLEVVNT